MGVTSATPANLVIGAGDVYVDGTDVGATDGNNIFRVTQTRFVPQINGVSENLLGTDYIQRETAEMEVSIPEIAPTQLGFLVPASASATATNGVQGSPPYTASTLAAATVVGQRLAIKLVSVTALTVGMFLNFGAGTQIRKVTRVGTAGAGGTGIDVDDGLSAALNSGAAVTQYTGDGGTQITSGVLSNRRVATSQYHNWELHIPGLNGLRFQFGVKNALMEQNADFTGADAGLIAPRVKVGSRLDAANPLVSPWFIYKIPADV